MKNTAKELQKAIDDYEKLKGLYPEGHRSVFVQVCSYGMLNASMLQISFNQLVYYEYGSEKPVSKPKLTNPKLKLDSGAATGSTELKPKLDSKGAATVGKEAATKLNAKSSTKEAQSATPQVMINT